jgi:hypothetical protein
MIGFLKGLKGITLLILLSPFIIMAIVFSFIQKFGGVKAEDTLIGKLSEHLL